MTPLVGKISLVPPPVSTTGSAAPAAGAPRRDVADIYDAVTRRDLGQTIRALPRANQQRLADKLSDIRLPERDKHRVRFLDALADLSARLLEPCRRDAERATALMARLGYREAMIRDELDVLDRTFDLLRDIAVVSMRSFKPSDYVRFVSRPGVDIPRFVATMAFFAGDRRVRMKHLDMTQRRCALEMESAARRGTRRAVRTLLSLIVDKLPRVSLGSPEYTSDWTVLQAFDIAATMASSTEALQKVLRSDHARLVRDKSFFPLDEMRQRVARAGESEAVQRYTHDFLIRCGIYRTDNGKMLRFGKMFKEGPIEGYVVLMPHKLRSYGYEGWTTGDIDDPTALLASDREHTLQHELQHVFDKITYVESALRSMQDGTGETLSNLLGMERRGRLAEMAFCHDLGLVEESMAEVRESVAEADPGTDEARIRVEADRWVHERMGRFKRGEALKRVARRLLDQAYRQACGLTYSQIVEPFAPFAARVSQPPPASSRGRAAAAAAAG
jgi:hypothetical protein